MAAPAPPLRSWADLPEDALSEVISRVQCVADRARAALACRPWREGLARAREPPRQLPWLLLPSADGSFRASCVLSGGAVHRHRLRVDPPGARCFGSHDGAWLFRVFLQGGNHQLVNVRTGEARALPSAFRPFDEPLDQRAQEDMLILVATLSAPPGDARCIAAGIVAHSPPRAVVVHDILTVPKDRVVLWRLGAQFALDFWPGPILNELDEVDVIYHQGAFHALTQGEHIVVYTPLPHPNGDLEVEPSSRGFLPDGRSYHQVVLARYLVVSRDELLMVVRFKLTPRAVTTSGFRVFRAVQRQMPTPAASAYRWRWSQLDALQGRVLFMGRGCSRAYEANQYPGIEEGVYFLDDSSFYDDFGRIAAANNRTYACNDNGKWSERGVESCFPGQEEASTYSPPTWLLL
ncbi:hypothetical protein ACP70R_001587 [Stipagrostis hirtigluma subsp. patula]